MSKAILVVSHGTSSMEQFQSGIAGMEQALAAAFPDRAFRRAFASGRERTRLRRQYGIGVDGIVEAMAALRLDGFEDVLVQPTFLSDDAEMEELRQEVGIYARQFGSFALGRPVLSTMEDYLALADAILAHAPRLTAGEVLVLVGAGSVNPMDSRYACLEYVLHDRGDTGICVGTLDGYPGLPEVVRRLDSVWDAREVCLMPLLMTVGMRAKYEILGEEPDAWASQLRAHHLSVRTVARGLGENPDVQALLVRHAQEALQSRKGWRGL